MSFTLSGHWVCPCPSKVCHISLGTLIFATRGCPSKERVSEHFVGKPLIAKHPVIGRESSCRHGVRAGVNTLLHSPLYSPLGMLRGYHPLCYKGLKNNRCCLARPYMPSQACADTRNDNMRGQYLMEIAIVCHISQVSGQGLKCIDDECLGRSPRGSVMDELAGVIHHCSLLFFIQGGHGVPGQDLRGQVESRVILAV
jgi:hypothetical protein